MTLEMTYKKYFLEKLAREGFMTKKNKKYGVTLAVTNYYYIEVKAENEDTAADAVFDIYHTLGEDQLKAYWDDDELEITECAELNE